MTTYEMNDLLIQSIGTALTLITIIVALYQGWKNSKKINDLAAITQQLSSANSHAAEQNILLRKQMALEVEPDLNISFGLDGETIKLNIFNNGHLAKIKSIRFKLEDCEMEELNSYKPLFNHQSLKMYGKYNLKNPDFKFAIEVIYLDKYSNEYIVKGKIVDHIFEHDLPYMI